jgi:DNA-binding FadR family transcriptional regulator
VLHFLRDQRTVSIEPSGSAKAAHVAHRRIYEAIAARDADAAERAMLKHLEEVERYFWAARKRQARKGTATRETATKGSRIRQ